MSYRLGVDVGGTFTDLLLIDGRDGRSTRAKVLSSPADPSRAVLEGIAKVCALAGVDPTGISDVLHGTTVATNAVLEGKGARVGLVATQGFRFMMQIARSHIPGGLGGWITHPKPQPLAPLEITIEAVERIDKDGKVLVPLDEAALRAAIAPLRHQGVEAMTVALINAYVDGCHERRVREILQEELPGIPVSISSEVLPEMLEYERAQTTVVNAYVQPRVSTYVRNLGAALAERSAPTRLHILRSDGGLSSAPAAERLPVNLLMSGPAGGVAGALAVARQSGFANLLTLDMGGTSTDVALIENGVARVRRETSVGDVVVRASSLDVRTVGAGGGSIAHVPALTRALRVGPQSAGALPGPAAYRRGGRLPTVTDANVVLGYLPDVRLAGELRLDQAAAAAAVQTIGDALGLSLHRAASGIVDIVNEAMFGALRLISIQQGYDPRNFALMAFGGAGPLHANALGKLTGSWPVIIPPSPGVLCAYGDATTRLRNETSRTFIRAFQEVTVEELLHQLEALAATAAARLEEEGVPRRSQAFDYEIDCRYRGQGLSLPVRIDPARLAAEGLGPVGAGFDMEHEKLFSFALESEHEVVTLRVIAQAPPPRVEPIAVPLAATPDPAAALLAETRIHADGVPQLAGVYDRARLRAGHRIPGPAIVVEMDATALVLPGHHALVDGAGCLLIRPDGA